MIEFRFRWFGHVMRRPVETPVRIGDQMDGSPIDRDRNKPGKTIDETTKKYLIFNGLSMLYGHGL